MPLKTRKFSATLYPTYRSKYNPESLVTKMVIGLSRDGKDNGAKTEFEAATTADVIGAVQRFAQSYGGACRASVRVVEGRKPAGFDEATRELFYNLDRARTG